jgi:hypothetical protein
MREFLCFYRNYRTCGDREGNSERNSGRNADRGSKHSGSDYRTAGR